MPMNNVHILIAYQNLSNGDVRLSDLFFCVPYTRGAVPIAAVVTSEINVLLALAAF